MGFTKLDENILQSSIAGDDSDTFKIWILLLAACKEDGIAPVSAVYLASIGKLEIDRVVEIIEKLSSPDPHSRTVDFEGRRIERVNGGYRLLNYISYRERTYSNSSDAVRMREKRKRDREIKEKTQETNAFEHVRTIPNISASSSLYDSEEKRSSNKDLDIIKDLLPAELKKPFCDWVQYMEEKKRPLTEISRKYFVEKILSMGSDRAISAIKFSISGGFNKLCEREKRSSGIEQRRIVSAAGKYGGKN